MSFNYPVKLLFFFTSQTDSSWVTVFSRSVVLNWWFWTQKWGRGHFQWPLNSVNIFRVSADGRKSNVLLFIAQIHF